MTTRRQNIVMCAAAIVGVAAAGIGLYIIIRRRRRIPDTSGKLTPRRTVGIPTFVDESQKLELPLVEKTMITANTRRFRFALPSSSHVPGLRAGEHITLTAMIDGKAITRKYTPVKGDETPGFVELIIKVYPITTKYTKGGVFSLHLDSLQVSDRVTIAGPVTRIVYEGAGVFACRRLGTQIFDRKHFTKLGIVVGGTGITPMLQIINEVLNDPKDPTRIWMLFANSTDDDVLLKDELDALAAQHPTRFKVWYTVSVIVGVASSWRYSVGRVDDAMLAARLPPPTPKLGVLLCGPPGLKQQAARPYKKEQILDF